MGSFPLKNWCVSDMLKIRLCQSVIRGIVMTAAIALLGGTKACAEDLVEFLNGTKLQGTILKIRSTDREFDFRMQVGKQKVTRVFTYEKVHAVTYKDRRFVLTPLETRISESGGQAERTEKEVLELIESKGKTDPDWLAGTSLNHPKTLDLDWPLKANGPWNESKNVGQYIWGRVNPNPSRWRPGIKLVYECMNRHQGSAGLLQRDKEKLGVMYFTLLQDYPRAAYWLQASNASVARDGGVHLAECYWRLGSKSMAMKYLSEGSLHFNAIKIYGDMGEIDKAVQLAERYAKTNFHNEANINAGDALRRAGRMDRAIEYYQKVVDRNQARNAEYLKRFLARANGAIEAIRLFDKADVSQVNDGAYHASALGYNGQLAVEVVVANSKISAVKVTKHREKQYYAALEDTPRQILETQGFQDIDGTSGATITSQAIVTATARAMSKGVK